MLESWKFIIFYLFVNFGGWKRDKKSLNANDVTFTKHLVAQSLLGVDQTTSEGKGGEFEWIIFEWLFCSLLDWPNSDTQGYAHDWYDRDNDEKSALV